MRESWLRHIGNLHHVAGTFTATSSSSSSSSFSPSPSSSLSSWPWSSSVAFARQSAAQMQVPSIRIRHSSLQSTLAWFCACQTVQPACLTQHPRQKDDDKNPSLESISNETAPWPHSEIGLKALMRKPTRMLDISIYIHGWSSQCLYPVWSVACAMMPMLG